MGTVWRARQEPFGRIVALKVLRSANLGDSDAERRFAREVELAAALSHPHLVKVLDGGLVDDMSYIAMELVEGDTLLRVIETCDVLPWTHAAALVGRLASGLAYLHDKNILHRDVKPANALLSFDGWVKLMDFGLAKMKEATVMTADGAVVGTLQYLPPEVIRGAPAAVPADLWPLGCILYRMVTGRSHIEASSQSGWLQQLTSAVIEPVQEVAPDVPAPLAELIMQLLARAPEDRPKSAAEVEERLDDLLAELEDTTWDEVLTPEQTEILLGKKRPAPPDAKKSGQLAAPVDVPSLTDPVNEPSAVTAKLPLRSESSPRQGSSSAAAPRSGATPRQGVRVSGGVRPPKGLRTPSGGVAMRQGSSGKLSVSASVPPQPASRRGAALALGGVAILGLALFALKRPARQPIPEPTVSVAEAPSVAPTPVAVSPVDAERLKAPLTGRALTYERFLPRLKGGGKGALAAVAELRSLSSITLGDKPCAYINWLTLERWFSDPRRAASPPQSPCAQSGPMELFTEKMYLNVLLRAKIEQADAAITSLALEHIADYPDDGRTWLTLGRLLELDNRPEAARLTYGIALARLDGVQLSHKGEFMGAAIARALMMVPGHDLERDIWQFVTEGKEARRALRGLGLALGKEGRDRFEAIVRAGTKGSLADVCVWVLAEFLEDIRQKPAAARKLANDHLARARRGELVLDYLIHHLAQRGMADEVDRVIGLEMRRRWYFPYLEYLRGTWPEKLDFKGAPIPRERFSRWAAWSFLERGDWKAARNEAEAIKGTGHDSFDHARLLMLDLAGRPGVDKAAQDATRDLLVKDPSPGDWMEAAGALSTPDGRPQMERLLAQVQTEPKGWYQALWLARCGQHAEALDALSAIANSRAAPMVDVAEIACRPLFEKAAGVAVPEAVLTRARAAEASVPAHAKPLHKALASGDAAGARKAAWNLFELYPQRTLPLVAVAWTEAGTGAVAEWPRVRARLEVALRARARGLWMLDELRAADRIAVARGARGP